MQAIVATVLGPPDVLVLRFHPVPAPAAGEALVRVHAVGVNFSDTERRRGSYDPPALPWIPGNEAAGIVEGVGPGVESHWLGRRVAFWAPRTSGAYAEWVAAPIAAMFTLRDDLPFPVASALPVQGLTAYGLAYAATQLSAGQTALVHAAAGGVGALLVQLLRQRGVTVFGTASSLEKLEIIRRRGAVPLSYGPGLPAKVGELTSGRGVDAVFDSIGAATQAESLASLGLYGHLVCFGDASGSPAPIHPDQLYGRCLKVSSFWLAADPPERWHSARRELQDWVLDGTLQVTIAKTLPLGQAAEAHRQLESRQSYGKLVLLP